MCRVVECFKMRVLGYTAEAALSVCHVVAERLCAIADTVVRCGRQLSLERIELDRSIGTRHLHGMPFIGYFFCNRHIHPCASWFSGDLFS